MTSPFDKLESVQSLFLALGRGRNGANDEGVGAADEGLLEEASEF